MGFCRIGTLSRLGKVAQHSFCDLYAGIASLRNKIPNVVRRYIAAVLTFVMIPAATALIMRSIGIPQEHQQPAKLTPVSSKRIQIDSIPPSSTSIQIPRTIVPTKITHQQKEVGSASMNEVTRIHIDSIQPLSGPWGTVVTLSGSGFDDPYLNLGFNCVDLDKRWEWSRHGPGDFGTCPVSR